MVKIAVNTRLLLTDKMDGIGKFTFESFRLITVQHPEVEFIFLFDRQFDSSFIFSSNITPIVIPPPTRHPYLYKIWFDYTLPYFLKKHNPDLFVSPDGFLSMRSNIKSLPVIHDLNFVHHPDKLSLYSKLYNTNFPKYARKATRIATVSAFSKQDIVESFGIDESKIDVVYNGVSSGYQPIDAIQKSRTKEKYANGNDYFIFVGSLYERKNIRNLLLAFDKFKANHSCNLKLIIVGRKVWWSKQTESVYNKLLSRNDILFTGRLPESDLQNLFASSLALVYVSLFEGFGIPLLEAMHCDVPIIASSSTAIPEVAGDAALLVNPENVEAIANAMYQIANDPEMRMQLISKGKLQREKFTWQKTADLLWQSMMRCI